MKIAIDVSPLRDDAKLAHRVRGVGFYTENLLSSLERYYKQHTYIPFIREEEIPTDADLVHYTYFDPFFLTLPLKRKKKTIVTVHDLIPLIFPQNFPIGVKGTIRWNLQRFLLRKVDHIITVSEASKRDTVSIINVDPQKVSAVHLAASSDFAKNIDVKQVESLRAKYSLPEKFVLYVGDITWNKNVPRLIQACTMAKIPLVLVGKALSQTEFDRKNQWNKDLATVEELTHDNEYVIKAGFITREELVLFYSAATLLVMPSVYEGFGLPILEAMQCLCPVVTSDRGSLKEVAGDAAYIVNPEDGESIKEGIVRVFDDKQLQKKLVEKGKCQAEKFSWRQTAAQTVAVYQKVYSA